MPRRTATARASRAMKKMVVGRPTEFVGANQQHARHRRSRYRLLESARRRLLAHHPMAQGEDASMRMRDTAPKWGDHDPSDRLLIGRGSKYTGRSPRRPVCLRSAGVVWVYRQWVRLRPLGGQA